MPSLVVKGVLGGLASGYAAHQIYFYGRDNYEKANEFKSQMKLYEQEVLERRAKKAELLKIIKSD